jgi:hypothetical protein
MRGSVAAENRAVNRRRANKIASRAFPVNAALTNSGPLLSYAPLLTEL